MNWREVRRQAGIVGVGDGNCKEWVRAALKVREIAAVYSEAKAVIEYFEGESRESQIMIHFWLQYRYEIADGTAGQIDEAYPDGFYGNYFSASEKLRSVYRMREGC